MSESELEPSADQPAAVEPTPAVVTEPPVATELPAGLPPEQYVVTKPAGGERPTKQLGPTKSAIILMLVTLLTILLIVVGYVSWRRSQPAAPAAVNDTAQVVEDKITAETTTPAADEPVVIAENKGEPAADTAISTSTITPNPAGQTYQSNKLGVAFYYSDRVDDGNGPTAVKIYETGDKTYIYPDYPSGYEGGQSIEMFNKDAADTLTVAIQKRFLAGIDEADCQVQAATLIVDPHPGMEKLVISFPTPADAEGPSESSVCPAGYQATNGLAYFLMDPAHPDRFYYLSIGQYSLPAGNNDPNTPWQNTLQITSF